MGLPATFCFLFCCIIFVLSHPSRVLRLWCSKENATQRSSDSKAGLWLSLRAGTAEAQREGWAEPHWGSLWLSQVISQCCTKMSPDLGPPISSMCTPGRINSAPGTAGMLLLSLPDVSLQSLVRAGAQLAPVSAGWCCLFVSFCLL